MELANNPETSSSVERFVEARRERIKKDLEILSGFESPSGEENLLRNYLANEIARLGLETKTDKAGNLWIESDAPEGEVLLSAHMDKIGPAAKSQSSKEKITGRLDDALGLSLILNLLKEGRRPSVLFTTEEEAGVEKIGEDGEIKIINRTLREGKFNFGARTAAEEMANKEFKIPKLAVVVDVSGAGKLGEGPIIYTSPMHFRFPKEGIRYVAKLLSRNNIAARFIEGSANDAIEFNFLWNVGTLAVEIPIENLHTKNEVVKISDIDQVVKLLDLIIENHKEMPEVEDVPSHNKKI